MVVSGKIMNNPILNNFNVKSLFFIILTILFLNHEVVYSHALENKNEIENLIESWIEQNPDKIRFSLEKLAAKEEKDKIENLMGLCRKCHLQCEAKKISIEEQKEIHMNYLQVQSKSIRYE